jgi:hypothetical protein
VNDLREEDNESAFDSMCVDSDSVSNDIDDSELEFRKQDAERI